MYLLIMWLRRLEKLAHYNFCEPCFSKSELEFLSDSGLILDPYKIYQLYQGHKELQVRINAPYSFKGKDCKCHICGKKTMHNFKQLPCGRYAIICPNCEKRWNAEIFMPIAGKYRRKYGECDNNTTTQLTVQGETCCEILKSHHEILKDDPERLFTDFIKSLSNCSCKEKIQ